MATTARIAALAVTVAVLASACQRSEAGQAASICSDLMNLRATVVFLEAPSATATVGEVRGDIEKLESTIGAVGGSSAVPESIGDELGDARDAYRDLLDGVGDDDPFSSVAAAAAAPARRLGAAYDAAIGALACGTSPSAV
jgi:hypothetical protein